MNKRKIIIIIFIFIIIISLVIIYNIIKPLNSTGDIKQIGDSINNDYQKITKEEIENILTNDNYLYKITSLLNISNQDKLNIAINSYLQSNNVDTVSHDKLEETFKNSIYGNLNLTPEDILCSCGEVLWTYQDNTYTKTNHQEESCTLEKVDYYLEDFEQDDGQYEVKVYYLFANLCSSPIELYGSYTNSPLITTVNSKEEINNYLATNINILEDKLVEYEYTFVKSNNNIKIVDIEIDED